MRLRNPLQCLALALVTLAAAGCLGDEGAKLEASVLSKAVLQPADVSSRFQRFDEGRLRASEQPRGRESDPERYGRVDGWKSRYNRPGTAGAKGLFVVESRVDLFEGGGAEQELEDLRGLVPRAGRKSLVSPELGDESFAWSSRQPGDVRDIVTFGVVWRRDDVVASVSASGFEGGATIEDVVRLARKQDARIVRLQR